MLSTYELRLNGQRPVVLRTGAGAGFASTIQLTNPDLLRNPADKVDPEVVLRRQSLGIVRDRVVADAFTETIRIDNYTLHQERCTLTLRLDSDFADIFEVRGVVRDRRGREEPTIVDGRTVTFAYVGLDDRRRTTTLTFSEEPTAAPSYLTAAQAVDGLRRGAAWARGSRDPALATDGDDRSRPRPRLARKRSSCSTGRWIRVRTASWSFVSRTAKRQSRRPPRAAPRWPAFRRIAWSRTNRRQRIAPGSPAVPRSRRATSTPTGHFAARWPTCACWSTAAPVRMSATSRPACPGSAASSAATRSSPPCRCCRSGRRSRRNTCCVLARLQATDGRRSARRPTGQDPARAAHRRAGTVTGEIPHTPYYGTVDATPLWLILLGEYERWTGDAALVERLWPNALAALRWIDDVRRPRWRRLRRVRAPVA